MKHEQEKQDGREAFGKGLTFWDNPHFPTRNSAERWRSIAWIEGFEEAEKHEARDEATQDAEKADAQASL